MSELIKHFNSSIQFNQPDTPLERLGRQSLVPVFVFVDNDHQLSQYGGVAVPWILRSRLVTPPRALLRGQDPMGQWIDWLSACQLVVVDPWVGCDNDLRIPDWRFLCFLACLFGVNQSPVVSLLSA